MKVALNNTDLHFEHMHWINELNFWKDELKSLNSRLGEIQKRWTDKEILAELDQFSNQFLIHTEAIEHLKNDIQAHEHDISVLVREHSDAVDLLGFNFHLKVRDKMDTERAMFTELKKRFFGYLSKFL